MKIDDSKQVVQASMDSFVLYTGLIDAMTHGIAVGDRGQSRAVRGCRGQDYGWPEL